MKGCADQVHQNTFSLLCPSQPPPPPSPSSAFPVAQSPPLGKVPVSPLPSGTPLSKCWLRPWWTGAALGSSECLDWAGRGVKKEARGGTSWGLPSHPGTACLQLQPKKAKSPLCRGMITPPRRATPLCPPGRAPAPGPRIQLVPQLPNPFPYTPPSAPPALFQSPNFHTLS